jgi:hypothetical protein
MMANSGVYRLERSFSPVFGGAGIISVASPASIGHFPDRMLRHYATALTTQSDGRFLLPKHV